ncbi:MAG TPA: hypothetical protein VFV63_15395 [Ilumatobacteraceae bacterium]|nr:hypothetical protein [Ilumatobacteraceae bacterium]
MLGRRAPWRHAVVLLVVAACAGLAWIGIIGPGAGSRSERFEAKQITVQPAGENGVRIREVVDQDFGRKDRHGYRRFIPHDFGAPIDVTASSPDASNDLAIGDNGDETEIRVGDPDETVTGQHRYVLSYTLPDAHLSGGELALDLINTEEELETGRLEIVVTGFELDDPLCNVGEFDDSGGCELEPDLDVYRAVISPLEPGDGVTIGGTIVGRTEVDEPPIPAIPERRSTNRGMLALAMIPLGLASAGAVFAISRWRGRNEVFSGGAADAAYGTLPNPSSTDGTSTTGVRLVADDEMDELATIEFVPPKGIEPWQGAVLLTERIDDATVGAWFSGLAARDGITLDKEGHDLVLGSGPKRSELDPATAVHIDKILDGRDRIELGTYDKKFATAWADVRKDQAASILASGWWRRLPPGATAQLANARAVGMLVAVIVLVVFGAGSFITALLGLFDSTALAVAFGAVVPAIFAYFLYRQLLRVRSATGSALALRTESFRRFLEASEGQHVDWAWKQGLLREYSAWAVALGAAGAWSKALNRSHVPPEEAAALSHPMLIYSMGSSISSSYTAPSSSGSGSSGGGSFSGGSVGGGGGGGSSGSW